MRSEDLYAQMIKRQIKALLERRDAEFWDIVRHCGGAYPVDLKIFLAELQDNGEIFSVDQRYSLSRPSGSFTEGVPPAVFEVEGRMPFLVADSILPHPHPADYDWRFTAATRALLTSEVCRRIAAKDLVGVFGAPSLFMELVGAGISSVLIDRNKLLAERLADITSNRVICSDLFTPLAPRLHCKLVVADPPWYPEFYEAFILRASEALEDDGYLLLSMLPWLTRPSAIEDRGNVLEFCRKTGFDLVECLEASLGYESPLFEQASLHAEGLNCEQWRSGDLYTFRKVQDIGGELRRSRQHVEDDWNTFELGRLVIKLRERDGASGLFVVEPASSRGSILTSVSRRAPERSRIFLWTSSNKAYWLSRPDIVRYVLEHIGKDGVGEAIEQASLAFNLLQQERDSLSILLRELMEDPNSVPTL